MGTFNQFFQLAKIYRTPWKTQTRLETLQNKKLQNIVDHAYRTVPYYNQLFKKLNLHPSDIKTREDLQKIPVITKKDILDNPHLFLSQSIDTQHLIESRTSGSTGTNFSVKYDQSSYDFERAVLIRANLHCGQKITDQWVTITSPFSAKMSLKWYQKLGILPKHNLSVLDNFETLASQITKLQPDILYGYASFLWKLSYFVEEHQLPIHPRITFSTAEVLDPKMRTDIELNLETQVFDMFGCVELGRTAWECDHFEGYHIDVDSVILQVCDPRENYLELSENKQGVIVYTGLYNHAMPLLRYAIGDLAIRSDEQCSCGRKFPLLKSVLGRQDDMIQTRSGALLSPIVFALILKYEKGIREYQFIQESISDFTLLIVSRPNHQWTKEAEQRVLAQIKQQVGTDSSITVKQVPSIPERGIGKLASVLSKLPRASPK